MEVAAYSEDHQFNLSGYGEPVRLAGTLTSAELLSLLGARQRDVLWLVMKEGTGYSFAGIGLGLAGAIAVTRLLSSELYGISATDAVTYVTVICAMVVVCLLACYVPTRRAMRVDPLIALRQE